MNSIRATHNLIAVSANNRESAINVAQDLDTTMLCALTDVFNLEPRRETNENQATGREEPDTIYDLGATVGAPNTFEMAQPQHFAFLLAYALGAVSTSAAGTGYEHVITPIAGDVDSARSLPSFTAAERYGKTINKRRYIGNFVDQVVATFAKDSWCKVVGTLKGTGQYDEIVTEETITAADNLTTLVLAANAVEGSNAAERLANVQRIRVELTVGVWTEVDYSAVSDDTPAQISITAPGAGGGDVTYKVLYVPTEPAWANFPPRVEETPLRVSECTLVLGGAWDGSAFQGGREIKPEVESVEWTLSNNLEVEFGFGAGGAFASRAWRPNRTQKISLDREMRDHILQRHIVDNDTFGLYLLAEGAVYDDPHKYQVELIFPKLGVLTAPIKVNGKKFGETGDLQVLEHDTYGSVVVKVKNLQSSYAA
jgi:hypothetical protein